MAANYNWSALQDNTSPKRNNVLDEAESKERQSYFRLLGLLFSDRKSCRYPWKAMKSNLYRRIKKESHVCPLYVGEHNANALLIEIEFSETKSTLLFKSDCGRESQILKIMVMVTISRLNFIDIGISNR